MNGSPSSRQRATPVASTRLSPRESPRSSHSPIRLNGRTPSSSEPCRRAGRWSYRISSRCLKRGMLQSSIIAGTEINHWQRNTMIVEAQVTINGSKAAIWAAITNIANASEIISGIEHIEVLDKPANGLVGLKWRETRKLFGKSATAEKWITDAAENEFYKTRAESDGFVFLSTISISESSGGITLTSSHDSKPQGIIARLLSIPMGFLFKGVAKKALLQDLNDIKAAVEQE